MVWGLKLASFFSGSFGRPSGTFRFFAGFFCKEGLTGLAVWYGFERSGFFGGVTSLMSSAMKFAARVGWLGLEGGEEWGGEDESPVPQVLRRGEGTAGVVGFGGIERRSRGVEGIVADLLRLASFMEVEDDEELLEVDKAEDSTGGCSRGGVKGNDSWMP
jgi:hypothetical protein